MELYTIFCTKTGLQRLEFVIDNERFTYSQSS